MILLDTNVISELVRTAPSEAVQRWFAAIPRNAVWTSAITVLELRYGLALLPDGQRRDALAAALDSMLRDAFDDRIATFDPDAAHATARFLAVRKRQGRPLSLEDGMLAGIAVARSATLATRNTRDFDGLGLTLVDPFENAR